MGRQRKTLIRRQAPVHEFHGLCHGYGCHKASQRACNDSVHAMSPLDSSLEPLPYRVLKELANNGLGLLSKTRMLGDIIPIHSELQIQGHYPWQTHCTNNFSRLAWWTSKNLSRSKVPSANNRNSNAKARKLLSMRPSWPPSRRLPRKRNGTGSLTAN